MKKTEYVKGLQWGEIKSCNGWEGHIFNKKRRNSNSISLNTRKINIDV